MNVLLLRWDTKPDKRIRGTFPTPDQKTLNVFLCRGPCELGEVRTPPVIACHSHGMSFDPAISNPEHYKVVFENERVRVLEYTDTPGDRTTPHQHPDSVMYTLSSFRRRLVSGDAQRDVELQAGTVGWLPAQEHRGERQRYANARHLRRAEGAWHVQRG